MKHSEEIKKLWVEKYKKWERKSWICRSLKISEKTLDLRIKKERETWKIEDERKNNWSKKRFSDEELIKFYEENENATLQDWWNKFWVRLQSIRSRLVSLKYSYKKKRIEI